MKYRINLYSSELKPKLELFSFSFVAVVWAAVLLLMLLSYYLVYSKSTQVESQLARTNLELQQVQADLNVKMTALQKRQPDKVLQVRVDELTQAVQAQKLLVSKLGTLAEINSGDYAGLMYDLAQFRQPQVWLTQIQVEDRQIFLQGSSVDSQAIPQWLELLRQSPYFRGQQFEQAKIYRDQEDGLRFDIGSVLTTATPKAGK